MKSRAFIYTTAVVLAGIFILLGVNFAAFFQEVPSERYLQYNNVRGIDLWHGGKPYPLNFAQQNSFIALLNQAQDVGNNNYIGENLFFEKMVIYRFRGEEITLVPISIIDKNMLLAVIEKNGEKRFLLDKSDGELIKLLSTTYDINPTIK